VAIEVSTELFGGMTGPRRRSRIAHGPPSGCEPACPGRLAGGPCDGTWLTWSPRYLSRVRSLPSVRLADWTLCSYHDPMRSIAYSPRVLFPQLDPHDKRTRYGKLVSGCQEPVADAALGADSGKTPQKPHVLLNKRPHNTPHFFPCALRIHLCDFPITVIKTPVSIITRPRMANLAAPGVAPLHVLSLGRLSTCKPCGRDQLHTLLVGQGTLTGRTGSSRKCVAPFVRCSLG